MKKVNFFCDCLNFCGDDPGIERGTVEPCARFIIATNRPKVQGMARSQDHPKALVLFLDKEPSDEDMRLYHDHLRHIKFL